MISLNPNQKINRMIWCATNTTGQIKIKEAVLAGELRQQQNRHGSGERSRKHMTETEELREYIKKFIDEVTDERQLRQIYTITHRAFIRDRGVQYERED